MNILGWLSHTGTFCWLDRSISYKLKLCMNVLGRYLTRLFYTSVFKVLSTQEDKHIKNRHAEYPTLHLMTQACVCVSYLSITPSAFAFLYVLPCKTCPTLCERLKQLGKVAAPLNCAPGGDLRKSIVSFRRLLLLRLLRGGKWRRWEMKICLAQAKCLGSVLE